ncbi:MAG: YfhO family protein [Chloroflexi bacterium]|nr:YfhO family protein [Chloroflexota bacterium]
MLFALILIYLTILGFIAWKRRAWLLDALAPALLAAFTLAFFWRVVSGDTFMPADGGDLGSFLFPTYCFIQRSLGEGVWPLWNPHIYSGVPFVAEIQSGILYLPHLIRFLVGGDLQYTDMQWLSMLHIWWAGVTTFLLARGLDLKRAPALFAAVAFMFSDVLLIHFGNLNLIAVVSWLPLALLGVHQTLKTGNIRWALAAGLVLGLASLVGHVQMTLYGLMSLGLWVGLWLLLTRGENVRRWRRAAMALIVPTAITLGLMAPILIPGLQMSAFSDRADWHYVQSVGFSLSPAQLIGLLVPGFFGRSPQLQWGLWPRVEVGYIGIITLVLAISGIAIRRDRKTWLLLGLAAFSLAFSLGIYSIIHGLFTWLLPGLEQLRAPARFIFLFDLAVALLAGRGLQALSEPWSEVDWSAFEPAWRLVKIVAVVAIAVGVPVIYAVLLLTQSGDPTQHLRASVSTIAVMNFILYLIAAMVLLYARRRHWIGAGLFTGLAIALLFIDLAAVGAYGDLSETNPAQNYYREELLDFLKTDSDLYRIDTRTEIDQQWQPDTALLQGLYDTSGVVNPLTLAYYADYLEATGSRSSDLYALANTKYLLGRKDIVLDWDVWELAYEGDPDLNVYLNRRFQPRAHLLGPTTPVPDLASAQAAIRAPGFAPLNEVIIEGGSEQTGSGGTAQIAHFGTNDMVVNTESAEPGTLLVAQVWYPGWQASIDGGGWQPVLRADATWQGLQVPSGQHSIELRFRPPAYLLGVIIAILTLIAVAAIWILTFVRNRQGSDRNS